MNTKSKAILFSAGYPFIDEVARIIMEQDTPEQFKVIMPSRRSLLFLSKKLSEKTGKPIIAPQMFSIEDFINFMYEKHVLPALPLLSPTDAVYFIDEANKHTNLIKTKELDTILPWAFKLYSDFEELYIEGISVEKLREIDTLIHEESLPEYVQDKISTMSTLYKEFYNQLKNRFSTRAIRYVKVSELNTDVFKGPYILSGFFALTRAEKRIFEKILKSTDSYFIAIWDRKIEEFLREIDIPVIKKTEEVKSPEYHIIKTASLHGEVFALKSILKEKNAYTIENVVVLPDESHLFAIVNNIDAPLKNISAGYPLIRTPFFSLLSFIEELITGKEDEKYLKTSYLNVILHPYIKNTRFKRETIVTRILMHTIEKFLRDYPVSFISLSDIENKNVMDIALKNIERQMPDVTYEDVLNHIKQIHDITIRSFENISTIGEFIEKVISLADFVSSRTTATLHPYGSPFIEATLNALLEIKNSLLREKSLSATGNYFNLLRNYIKSCKVPFKGTPLRGLQILGTLETRNLHFKQVFYLDVNEGIIPDVKKEDTILSDTLREYLGLSTAGDRENITRYYFFNLIRGADEVYLFYTENKNEPSRYIEMLKWEKEKEKKEIGAIKEKTISFNITFSHTEPVAIDKTSDIMEKLQDFTFSPTQIDTYLSCPLKFYYKNFLFPPESREVERTKTRLDIGNIVHKALERYFKKWIGRELIIEDIEKEKEELYTIVDMYFGDITGNELFIQSEQVKYALGHLLKIHEKEFKGIKILGLERKFQTTIKIDNKKEVKIKGKIDRIHEHNGRIYIIDYKTGGLYAPQVKKLPSFDNRDDWPSIIGSFQLPLYIILYHNTTKTPYEKIEAQLWSIKHINSSNFLKSFTMDFLEKQKAYEDALKTIISEILDPDIPFKPVDREKANNICTNCPYRAICDRLWTQRYNRKS